MSHTPEHAARTPHTTGASAERAAAGEPSQPTSEGTSLGLNIVLFLVLFLAFAVGLYLMSLMTPVLFLAGLGLCLVALFGTFTVVPHVLT